MAFSPLSRRELLKCSEALREDASVRAPGQESVSRIDFTDFKRKLWRGYQDLPYQRAIDDVLNQIARYVLTGGQEGIARAAIFAPPRHGKTRNVSRMFPAWLIAQNPDLRLIMTSYGADLATRNSRAVRNLIDSEPYQALYPHIQLAQGSASAHLWDLEGRDGGVLAAGVGGGIGGHGGNVIIIDDVIKSRSEAESETYRTKTEDWYQNELLTRLEEPGGAILLMLTRWHTHDLAGFILENEPGEWSVLSLPALAEADDPLGRIEGEALWEARYSRALLEERREKMGEYAFASLYQQRPLPSGGGLFDTGKIPVLDYAPDCKQVVRFYDLAVTARRHADYTVGLKLGVTPDELFVVLDVYRAQKEFPDVKAGIVQNAAIDGRSVRIRLEAEKAGLIGLQELLRDPAMRSYTLDATPPEGDKYSRALPVSSRVNGGRLAIVRAAWNRAFLDELSVFPAGGHDDQVDSLSGAYDMLAKPKGFVFA